MFLIYNQTQNIQVNMGILLKQKFSYFNTLKTLFVIIIGIIKLSQCEIPEPQLKLTQQQKRKVLSTINGISQVGDWKCIDDYFYEPIKPDTQCFYFQIPRNSKDQQLNIPDSSYLSDTFFKKSHNGATQAFFWSSQNQKISDQVHIILYEGTKKYITRQAVQFNIDLSSNSIQQKFYVQNSGNQTKLTLFSGKNVITTVSLYDKRQELVKYDIMTEIQIYIAGSNNYNHLLSASQQFTSKSFEALPKNLPITVRIISQSIKFQTSFKRQQYFSIFLIILAISLCQCIFIFINPTTSAQQNVSKARRIMFRISQWFILQMYCFIFYFSSVIYIAQLGMQYFDTQLGYLIYIGLLNIGIGMLFLRKYQMVLQKFTNRLKLILVIIFIAAYFWFANKFFDKPSFWIFQTSIMLIHQVLHSMTSGGKGGLPKDLIGFMVISRLPLFYMLGIDQNVFGIPPAQPKTLIFLFIVITMFLFIIHLQSTKGGQFMIPNQIIPGYYDYYYQQNPQNQKMKQQCPICTTPINKAPDSHFQMTQVQSSTNNIESLSSTQNNRQNETLGGINNKVRYMKTPCNHIFHIDCLTKWMQAKLVCPYCRSTLPQLASLQKQ